MSRWLLCGVVIALGVGARLLPWAEVFPPDGSTRLLPADSHYYVRFARLQRNAFPRWVDEDRFVNFPKGALILWPPLHTASVAVAEWLAPDDERGAAFVGPAWSSLWLLVMAWVLRRKPLPMTLWALFVLAVAPIAVQAGELGNADHHIHEVFGAALLTLLLFDFLEAPTRTSAVTLGVLIGSARLFTTVGVLAGPLCAAALVVAQLANVRPTPLRLIELTAGAVLTSLAAVIWFGRLTLDFETVSLFGPLSLLAALSAPVALAGTFQRSRERWGWLVTLGLGALLTAQALRAVSQLRTADPLLGRVYESQPLWAADVDAVGLLHALLFLGPMGVVVLLGQARARRALFAVLVVTGGLMLLGSQQIRFFQAATGATAIALALAFGSTPATSVVRRTSHVIAFGLGLSMLLTLERGVAHETFASRSRPTMEWLKAHSPTPGQEPTYGILGGAMLGHFIELWAERPAMASTFSQTSWHVAANAEAARILASQDDDDAWREARSQRMAFVVLMPHQQLLGVSETEWPRALARRLYERDGSPHFPLLFTSPEKTPNGDPQLKVFGVEGVLTGDAGTE